MHSSKSLKASDIPIGEECLGLFSKFKGRENVWWHLRCEPYGLHERCWRIMNLPLHDGEGTESDPEVGITGDPCFIAHLPTGIKTGREEHGLNVGDLVFHDGDSICLCNDNTWRYPTPSQEGTVAKIIGNFAYVVFESFSGSCLIASLKIFAKKEDVDA